MQKNREVLIDKNTWKEAVRIIYELIVQEETFLM